MMNKRFENTCHKVDAAVFNGDSLYDADTRKGFKRYLERWNKELEQWEVYRTGKEKHTAMEAAQ